jgi:catechol 2,3-dioxygenase-like lactoylglutathione lyase family enzyme
MFSHIMIGTNDLDRAKAFYDKLLGTLDVPPAFVDRHRIFYMTPGGTFSVSLPIDGKPATATPVRPPPKARNEPSNGAASARRGPAPRRANEA